VAGRWQTTIRMVYGRQAAGQAVQAGRQAGAVAEKRPSSRQTAQRAVTAVNGENPASSARNPAGGAVRTIGRNRAVNPTAESE